MDLKGSSVIFFLFLWPNFIKQLSFSPSKFPDDPNLLDLRHSGDLSYLFDYLIFILPSKIPKNDLITLINRIQNISLKDFFKFGTHSCENLKFRLLNNPMKPFLLLFLVSIALHEANSSEFQVEDQQNWYHEEKDSSNSNTEEQSEILIDQSSSNYSKLLQIARQMIMTEQMVKLYQERLEILKNLKEEIQKSQLQKEDKQSSSEDEEINEISTNKRDEGRETKDVRNEVKKHKKVDSDSPFLVLLNQYQITFANSNETDSMNKIQQKVVMIPPFIIDKEKSSITLISKIQKSKVEDQEEHSPYNYVYGQSSNRLLFYWLDKASHQKSQAADQLPHMQPQTYALNLALQIKPNKIKSVKILYRTQNNSSQEGFVVEEQVTSYQSHELIDQSFKWHNALDFDNMLVGFRGSSVLIKSKDKRIHEIEVESKVLHIQSINQFKLLVICKEKIITVNVRSLLIMDQIRYAYFLGNRTLIQQKQMEKQRSSSEESDGEEIQEEDEYLSQKQAFWQSNFTKQYEGVRAVAYHYIEVTKQLVILLSNADLLLYSNDKIIGSSNLGNQLSKELGFEKLSQTLLNQVEGSIRISIDMLPSNRHILIHSNFHPKILIFNVTIPGLTQLKGTNSGLSFFSSSQRATELTSKFWVSIPLSVDNPKQNSLNFPILVELFLVSQQSRLPTLNSIDQRNLIIFSAFTENISENGIQSNQLQKAIDDEDTQRITILQHRVLLNLFENLSAENLIQGPSEGRSYWWNAFMVLMIVLGVFIFKKCKGSTQKSKQEFDFESQPKISRSKQQAGIPNRKKPVARNIQESQQFNQNYNDKIISELQSYLEKQGKKLTKQEIAHLMQDLEEQDELQQKPFDKPQMKIEENIDQFKEELDLMSKQQNGKNLSKSLDDGPKIKRNEELSQNKKKYQ